jgi:rRNA maturation RNase YbeY
MKPLLEIINSCRQPIPRKFLLEFDKWLRPRLSAQLSSQKLKHLVKKKVVVVFVSRSEGRKLNLKFRERNYATDVLSFAPIEDSDLGELVFCYDVIKKQANEHRLSLREEIAYMYIHGLLHLLGFDHEKSKAGARKMFAHQDQLFEKFLS